MRGCTMGAEGRKLNTALYDTDTFSSSSVTDHNSITTVILQ